MTREDIDDVITSLLVVHVYTDGVWSRMMSAVKNRRCRWWQLLGVIVVEIVMGAAEIGGQLR